MLFRSDSITVKSADGTGSGTITVNITGLTGKFVPYGAVTDDSGNSCTATCTFDYPAGSDVVFQPATNDVVTLVSIGACGNAATCSVHADAPHTLDVVYTPVLTQQFTIELTDLGLPSTFCCAADIVPHARVISNVMPPCEANAEQVYDHYDCTATVPTFATIYLAIQLDAPTELFKSWGSDSGCAPNTLMCKIGRAHV